MRLVRVALVAALAVSSHLVSGCSPRESVANAAPESDRAPAARDPFGGLAPPKADPSATPYRFETGPHVPKPDFVVEEAFPPAHEGGRRPTPPPAPELKILRTQPTGKPAGAGRRADEALVGAVTATFNQPMIPLGALEDVKQAPVPLEIEPKVPGRFRWLGTTTVTFEPEGRMPFATNYAARIPAGTKSALGKSLATEVSWSFQTPRPIVIAKFPNEKTQHATPDTVVAMSFNQDMDAALVAAQTTLSGPNGKISLVPVPATEWAAIKGANLGSWDPKRSVVLRPKTPLEKDTAYRVEIAAGLRSAEGPLATTTRTTWGWRTYAPLRVVSLQCGWDGKCPPYSAWTLTFNNPLDGAPLGEKITVAPAIEMMPNWYGGNAVSIEAAFAPATKYTVSVSPEVKDAFGQTLGRAWSGSHTTGDASPSLEFAAHGVVVSEAKGNRTLAVAVTNVFGARVRIVKVKRDELVKYRDLANQSPWFNHGGNYDYDPLAGIAAKVDRPMMLPKVRNVPERVGIPLDEALGESKTGLLYVDVSSPELRKEDRYAPKHRGILVQVTDIGLTVKYDAEQMIVLATSIEEAKPMAGVALEIVQYDGKSWWKGVTGADGTAHVPGPRTRPIARGPLFVRATAGDDFAFVEVDGSGTGGWVAGYNYTQNLDESMLRSFFFTDRGIYRPEETVRVKGLLRSLRNHPGGGLSALPAEAKTVSWTVRSPRGEEMAKGKSELGPFGSIVFDVTVPRGADLGSYYVNGSVEGLGGHGGNYFATGFQIQEYRAPEYKVEVDTGKNPWLFGQSLVGTIHGAYYFGAPMAGAETTWTLTRSPGFYAPPGNDGFSFGDGRWSPWFGGGGIRGGGYGGEYDGEYDESPRRGGYRYGYVPPPPPVAQGAGRLDEKGLLVIEAVLEPALDPQTGKPPVEPAPGSFTLEAQVFDQNRQAIAGRSSFVVHPAELYVGMRLNRTVVREKEKVPLDVIAVAIDGARLETAVEVAMVEQEWKPRAEKTEDGGWTTKWELKETETARCTVSTGKDPKPCAMVAPRAGHFLLRGRAKDAKGRPAASVVDVYVYGSTQVTWHTDNANKIELVPDRTEYKVGDVAKVLVKSPFPRGEGLLSFEADGILESRRITLDGSATAIEVPITEKHLPNVRVSLSLARGRLKASELPEGGGGEDLGRPSYAAGEVNLSVSRAPKTLTVTATPSRAEAGPGESIDLAITLKDAAGKPVAGEAAVMLVDEGVLALLGYETPDPLAAFWVERQAGAALEDIRNLLLKQEKELTLALRGKGKGGGGRGYRNGSSGAVGGATAEMEPMASAAPMADEESRGQPLAKRAASRERKEGNFAGDAYGGEDDKNSGGQPIAARTDFASTAFYAGAVRTDASGKATLAVKLPDNLTTFRIMVVAADAGDRFGKTDGQLTVRKRVLVRPSLPRFLNYGDSFEAAVVVHNETGKDGQVEVIARGVNLAFDEAPRKAVYLKTGTSAEVRWKARAVAAGRATVQFGASFDGSADAAEIGFPVKVPATGEAFATYGTTEGSISQPVLMPEGVIPEFGGLDVQTSSTALTTLGDAVDYLYDYPYECLEQTASRILPIFALKDVIRDFKLGDAATNAKADRLSKDGIARIVSLQNWDGGFKFWPNAYESDPWVSGYAVFVLLRGKEAGFAVPETTLARAKNYLQQHGLNPPKKDYGEYWRRAVQTQTVLVLTEMGEKPVAVAQELYDARAKLPFFSRAHLMVSWKRMNGAKDPHVVELLKLIDDAAVETPSTAHYAEVRTESRALKLLMHSEARTDAIVLWAMLETRPNDPLIPKVVKGLNDARIRGRWNTTQENAWVLLGMSRYYKTYEKVTPEFVARTWMEDLFVGETKFSGRSMDVKKTRVPMETLLASAGAAVPGGAREPKDIVIAKDGPGRLYYRLGLTYAPKSLVLKPEEQGFSTTRVYEAVDDPGDVVRGADGNWTIKAGSTVRVRLTVVVSDRRYYAAIVDPLPAGLEGVNAALATTAQSKRSAGLDQVSNTWSWYAPWAFNHVQMRDDRVEVFADALPAGIYEYTYLARATTFGNFVVPPLKAEEMYAPEVFGRNGTTRVTVK